MVGRQELILITLQKRSFGSFFVCPGSVTISVMERVSLRSLAQRGFTVVETIVVLAIIGLLTLAVVAGSNNGIKNERFSGELRDFTDVLRQSQTLSYTVKTGAPGDCGASTAPAPGSDTGATACFWRGVELTYYLGTGTSVNQALIYGADTSVYGGGDPTNPGVGLYGAIGKQNFPLNNLQLTDITYTKAGVTTSLSAQHVNSLALAFLAPDGRALSDVTGTNTMASGQSRITYPSPPPFIDNGLLTFYLTDQATSLSAIVTFDPASGTITTKVQ